MLKYSTYHSIHSRTDESTNNNLGETIHIIMKKNKHRIIRLILIASILLLSLTGFMTVFADAGQEVAYEKIVVEPGDTLWAIGTEHKPEGMDIRDYVNQIQHINGLSSSHIQTGQLLKLPYFD
ncbi:LysM peptidoglycan-binding domain-containing protein [Paenibacillus sp. PDC88]|uniref:LysM peptidoglycan-binding domain-containing protein n=1 Tax=Paenibacillus sp. PDC88 TaxID=1884375 RepID=UPI00089D8B0E|nr:LysM peptidoglycan-binding domain-containing protein [Paenibacillus sp. PDC88]SDW61785.1 LysM repeat-containing protein [Paenibacillus sp. PDC88]